MAIAIATTTPRGGRALHGRTLHWASLATGVLILLLAASGCQQTPSKPMVANLPPPSFDGPRIVKPTAPTATPPSANAGLTGPAAWSPKAPPRDWKWIVIHHSASPGGNMTLFDKEHKAKGWDGVGYHFVIGNGTNSGDGQIEVTPRWSGQKWGAHAKTLDNRYNDHGIGICLVGNFDLERPTEKQLASLTKLTAYLMQTYRVPSANVVGHRDTKPTECPGRFMNLAAIRHSAQRAIADAGGSLAPLDAQAATAELLRDVAR